jgi:hypothetical protein
MPKSMFLLSYVNDKSYQTEEYQLKLSLILPGYKSERKYLRAHVYTSPFYRFGFFCTFHVKPVYSI